MRGEWLNRSQLCKLLAIDPTNFDKSWRPLVPADAQEKKRGQILFHVRSVIDAYIEREVSKRAPSPRASIQPGSLTEGDEDGLLIGPPSKWLERCHQLKAEEMELDLDVKRGDLIPREEIANLLLRLASVLRPSGMKLRKEHGEEAARIYDEAIDKIAEMVEASAIAQE